MATFKDNVQIVCGRIGLIPVLSIAGTQVVREAAAAAAGDDGPLGDGSGVVGGLVAGGKLCGQDGRLQYDWETVILQWQLPLLSCHLPRIDMKLRLSPAGGYLVLLPLLLALHCGHPALQVAAGAYCLAELLLQYSWTLASLVATESRPVPEVHDTIRICWCGLLWL